MIMKKNEKPSLLKGKGAAVGIVICFVAVIALVGAYTFNNYRKDLDEQVARSEEQAEELAKDESEETTADDILPTDDTDEEGAGTADSQENAASEEAGIQNRESGEDETSGDESAYEADDASASGGNTSGVWFSEDSTLTWPASGAVIMGYSMDQTVFFQTLEQYQYNPAMIIEGEVGETIGASAAGIVTNIEDSAKTGTTVTLDMGNGYSAVYGQLTDVPLAIGDYVAQGETVGTLSEPTKYYSVEGPNLYFEVQKDGEPIDPMQFME